MKVQYHTYDDVLSAADLMLSGSHYVLSAVLSLDMSINITFHNVYFHPLDAFTSAF